MTKTIVIASGKGGAGKTSVTAGVGCALAELGAGCLMIDADVGLQSLDIALGVYRDAAFDFSDAAEGIISLADAAVPLSDFPTACVLAAPTEPEGVGANTLKNLVRHIGELELYDYVLIDAPAGLGEGFRMAARAAESGIIVATSDPICLRTSEKTAAALRDCGVMDIKLVVNRVRPVLIGYGLPNIDDAMDAAGVGLLGYIPEDEGVIVAGAMGIPVIKTPSGAAARAYRNIARRICGENIPLMKVKRR